jgi:RNA polymerase sigma-70 factor (ECF subfamily)
MKIAKPESETSRHDALASTLLTNLAAFQSFARGRLHDDTLAADAVQESLLRALKAEKKLSHNENLLAWFYRILRNVLNDLHRHRARQDTAMKGFAERLAANGQEDHAFEDVACRCFRDLLPTLRPEYVQVIELVDLGGRPQDSAADELGLSRNNLKVRLHRARRQLRERLEQTCRTCTTHGCLDCTCEDTHHER